MIMIMMIMIIMIIMMIMMIMIITNKQTPAAQLLGDQSHAGWFLEGWSVTVEAQPVILKICKCQMICLQIL